MKKDSITLVVGLLCLVLGLGLGWILLLQFPEVLDGDSIIPDVIFAVSNFTIWNYAFLFLSFVTTLAGLILIAKVVLHSIGAHIQGHNK